SPRAPSASDSASRRMDLPAPVSPVSTERPGAKSMSSRSIRTISRIDRRDSIQARAFFETGFQSRDHARWGMTFSGTGYHLSGSCSRSGVAAEELSGLGQPRARILARLEPAGLQQRVGILVPLAVRIVGAEHGGRRLGFRGDAHGVIGLGQARQRLFDMAGVGVVLDHVAEALDGGNVFAPLEIVAADLHLLAGELVAGETHL